MLQNLLLGGFSNDPTFGGGGPEVLRALTPFEVYATTIPLGTMNFNAEFLVDGVPVTVSAASLVPGVPLFIAAPPPAAPALRGFGLLLLIAMLGWIGARSLLRPA